MLKLFIALFMGASVWANVTTSKLPRKRPENLNTTRSNPEGVLIDGKIKFSIPLYDGLYYQRDNREQTIPLMDYLLNEFPKVDFTNLKFKKIMVVATAHSDKADMSFMSSNGVELLRYDVPRVADPNVVFGEYSQIIIEDYQIFSPLSYLTVSGAVWINNIMIEMETGIPNFNTDDLPIMGRPTGDLAGVLKPEFNEQRYEEIYNEIIGFEQTPLLENPFVTQPIEEVEQYYNPEFVVTVQMGNIRNNKGILNVQLLSGRADIKGFEVVFRNGSRQTIDMSYQFKRNQNSVDFQFRNNFRNAWVTVLFTNATPDARAQVQFKR